MLRRRSSGASCMGPTWSGGSASALAGRSVGVKLIDQTCKQRHCAELERTQMTLPDRYIDLRALTEEPDRREVRALNRDCGRGASGNS